MPGSTRSLFVCGIVCSERRVASSVMIHSTFGRLSTRRRPVPGTAVAELAGGPTVGTPAAPRPTPPATRRLRRPTRRLLALRWVGPGMFAPRLGSDAGRGPGPNVGRTVDCWTKHLDIRGAEGPAAELRRHIPACARGELNPHVLSDTRT